MDFDKYAQCMAQKYQVAVAIAVLRNKPDNLSPEQYVAQLKDRIEWHDQDSIVPLTEDFHFADTDFNFEDNDDSFTIDELNKSSNAKEILDASADSLNLLQNKEINKNTNQNKFYENYKSKKLNDNEVTILGEASTDETNSLGDILRTLKDIDANEGCRQLNNFNPTKYSQMITSPSLINFSEDIVEENATISDNPPTNDTGFINLVDKSNTQVTIDERVKATVVKNFTKSTEISKPDDIIMETTNERVNDNFKETIAYEMEVEIALKDIVDEPNENFGESNVNLIQEKTKIVTNNILKELNKPSHAMNQEKGEINNKINTSNINKDQNIALMNSIDNSTQDTILYTLQGFTQNTYSQSQYQNIEIPEAFIYGNKNKHISNEVNNCRRNDENEREQDVGKDNMNKDKNIKYNPNILTVDSSQIQYIIDKSGKTYAIINSLPLDKDSIREDHAYKNIEASSEVNNKMVFQKEVTEENMEESTQENAEANSQTNDIFDIDGYLDKDTTECEEVVPFKVVKELSKIKASLSKRQRRGSAEYSSDSGYRSDSQCSFKSVSARVSDDWVHQSANCLYSYITQCPLVSVTQEIVNEIAQVLGRLIDRLHEEEKYPLFLEQLLEKVDSLLSELSQDNGSHENILLEKDETIQRLLLLNKSIHILKFSIEKIATNLEKVHTSLTSKENLYELTNITEVENLRYTFYILEMFIQMYVKVKDSTQSTQSSQDTKILKKSSITEIWRKKWNLDLKESKNVGSQEKSCALSKCGDVLNKIIVDCMEGYGLVSFAALQCFNLLQS